MHTALETTMNNMKIFFSVGRLMKQSTVLGHGSSEHLDSLQENGTEQWRFEVIGMDSHSNARSEDDSIQRRVKRYQRYLGKSYPWYIRYRMYRKDMSNPAFKTKLSR